MAAITFLVMAVQPSHSAQNEAGKYQRGDIVEAHLTKDVPEPPHPNSRFVFIDVPDVPLAAARKIKKLRDRQQNIVDGIPESIRRRIWYVDHTLIPIGKKQELLENRRASAAWEQFKGVVKRRETETNLKEEDFNE